MRYRKLDDLGDMTFGQGSANFFVDDVACVAQKVATRLRLWQGEWFLDTTDGTPWMTQVLGENTKAYYDLAIRQRVLDTDGVTSIDDYKSSVDPTTRKLTVQMTISTVFGTTTVEATL